MEADSELAVAAALRAQLQSELQSIKQCAYQAYDCTQLTLDGYKYCLRHILQDKTAPYRQCSYVYNTNGKRCYLPAPRDKKDTGYCSEHALKLHLTTSKRNSHCQPPRTAEVLLNSVSHYIKRPKTHTLSSTQQSTEESHSLPQEENEGIVTKSQDPFVDVDANSLLATGNDILDMCSESESDVEPTVYGSVWHETHAESSDNDSIDSEQEDALKHANIYSAEEITLITRDKLIRLQSLYIDQYRYLQHMLREHRRRYLFALKNEKETLCNINNQVHDTPKEQRLYKKLKVYNSYHKKHGTEAICVKRVHERRLKITEGCTPKPQSYTKCTFSEEGFKCGDKTLPVTRYCLKHILEDPNQILFRGCGKMCGDIECRTPVITIFDDAACRLHTDFPPIRSYNQVRKDSESDLDDAATRAASTSFPIESSAIKVEEIDIKFEDHQFLTDLNKPSTSIKLESGYIKRNMDSIQENDFVPDVSTIMAFVNTDSNDVELPLANDYDGEHATFKDAKEDDKQICTLPNDIKKETC